MNNGMWKKGQQWFHVVKALSLHANLTVKTCLHKYFFITISDSRQVEEDQGRRKNRANQHLPLQRDKAVEAMGDERPSTSASAVG